MKEYIINVNYGGRGYTATASFDHVPSTDEAINWLQAHDFEYVRAEGVEQITITEKVEQ
jgi:hypothetical protein